MTLYYGAPDSDEELYHYGVPGMRWGIRRANKLLAKNVKLAKKAATYDKRAAANTLKSEKAHAKYDLGSANKAKIKSAKYAKKAAALNKKALKTDSEYKRSKLESKAAKLQYKSAKNNIKGDSAAKTTGYGLEASKYSAKSAKLQAKAAKARMKIAQNTQYKELMKRRISSLDKDEIRKIQDRVKNIMR